MSMTTDTPQGFLASMNAATKYRIEKGKRNGPCYTEAGIPIIWNDQVFDRDIAPTGEVSCKTPLRVGATNGALNVILVGSSANEEEIVVPSGATITLTLQQGDTQDGIFEDVGPSICVKAPDAGMKAGPDELLARFAIGDFRKPWLKVALEFGGVITGGCLDCALAYMPR